MPNSISQQQQQMSPPCRRTSMNLPQWLPWAEIMSKKLLAHETSVKKLWREFNFSKHKNYWHFSFHKHNQITKLRMSFFEKLGARNIVYSIIVQRLLYMVLYRSEYCTCLKIRFFGVLDYCTWNYRIIVHVFISHSNIVHAKNRLHTIDRGK